MKPKSTKRAPAAAADAVRLVAEIASLQERRAEVLARLAAEVREMDIAIARATDALGFEVRNARIPTADMAAAVKDALAERRVNTGQLCSRFCDAMARRGAQDLFCPRLRHIQPALLHGRLHLAPKHGRRHHGAVKPAKRLSASAARRLAPQFARTGQHLVFQFGCRGGTDRRIHPATCPTHLAEQRNPHAI